MIRFGSSGIRGPVGTEVTADLALRIGRALAEDHERVVVGHDARTSSPMLAEAAVAGLLAGGAEVNAAGLLPTPALARAARAFDCGLMITASHNPAPDNGFKLWNPDGSAFNGKQRARIEVLLSGGSMEGAPWASLHAPRPHASAIRDHVEAVRQILGAPARRLRILLDCGNGAACPESPGLLRTLGHDVVTLNAQPDGTFPGRPSEPNEVNLRDLAAAVKATGADLGLAHDGDADRCMAVTDRGAFVSGDALLVLFAKREARSRIVVPVDASRVVEDLLPDVDVVRTRVGDAYVSETIRDRSADWGGEPSGAWIFPRMSLCPDGPFAAAALAHLVAESGPLSRLVEEIPAYPLARESVPVPAGGKDEVVDAVAAHLPPGDLTRLDGVRVDLDAGWILVRASGTEPKVRLTAEARRREDLEGLMESGRRALAQSMKDAGGTPRR